MSFPFFIQEGWNQSSSLQCSTEQRRARRRRALTCQHTARSSTSSATHSTFCCTRSRVNLRRPVSKLESSFIWGHLGSYEYSSTLIMRCTLREVSCYRTMLLCILFDHYSYCTIKVLRVNYYLFISVS